MERRGIGEQHHYRYSYPCSLCKREFSSGQSLGDHMHVHRGDTAPPRHCSPPLTNPNPNPNPNPKPTPSDSIPNRNMSPPQPPITYTFSALFEPLPRTLPPTAARALERDLELGVGVCTGASVEEALDLELRLGYC